MSATMCQMGNEFRERDLGEADAGRDRIVELRLAVCEHGKTQEIG